MLHDGQPALATRPPRSSAGHALPKQRLINKGCANLEQRGDRRLGRPVTTRSIR
jgi:hypothetical protein